MLISIILAWVATISAAMAALKFIARISGSKKLNRFFHKCHIPFGVILLISGLLHGILAGNAPGTDIADIQLASQLFTLNWGTGVLIVAALLGLTYMLRRTLKKAWMPLHRILTAALITMLVLHMCSMGVQLFDRVFGGSEETAEGYSGTTTVSVTVSGGKVTAIDVVDENDSPQFFSRAESVLDDIISQQSLEVDTVSGATFSSAGLINAVYDALGGAVQSGTLNVTSIDLSQVARRH